jgi:hypothetical protein
MLVQYDRPTDQPYNPEKMQVFLFQLVQFVQKKCTIDIVVAFSCFLTIFYAIKLISAGLYNHVVQDIQIWMRLRRAGSRPRRGQADVARSAPRATGPRQAFWVMRPLLVSLFYAATYPFKSTLRADDFEGVAALVRPVAETHHALYTASTKF